MINRFYIILITLLALITACQDSNNVVLESETSSQGNPMIINGVSLDTILSRGKLIAITNNNPTSYFIYKGRPMGYQYDLLSQFCKDLNLELEIKIVPSITDGMDSIKLKKADILASGLTVLRERKELLDFTNPITQTHQVLIQMIPDDALSKSKSLLEKRLIRDLTKLAGKQVFAEEGSAFIDRLKNLQNEIGDSIEISTYSGLIGTDSIMSMISLGKIKYAVTDYYTAKFFMRYYNNLDINTPVSFEQNIAWGIPHNSSELKDTINAWIRKNENTLKWAYMYNKYFEHNKKMNKRVISGYNLENGKISPYDHIIKINADKISWDWRLIAAQISVESGFNPNNKSWAGASGLMQVMPATAARLNPNCKDLNSPSESIAMGVKLNGILYDSWLKTIPDSVQAKKFSLASYNIGKGHVFDAQRLASKHELDPKIWDKNVELMIKKLSSSHYYQDPVVKHGYCRGSEAYNYVRRIFSLYQNYQNFEITDE